MTPSSVLALLLCDWISQEAGTGRPTLRGLHRKIQGPGLPGVLPLCCYAELLWMPGVTARVGFRLLPPAGETVRRRTLPATFPADRQPLPPCHTERVALVTAGVYRLQVLFGEDVAGERTLPVRPPGGSQG
jgi:hypothetical protein